ncbi:MAG: ATP-binding cassette domain-containing protein [bacterium]|nr:ATP-binding cassette domain-containing protein [bacterium]
MNETIVEVKNITKSFKSFTALHDVSLTLENGKIYGLIGQNGAGKTTLMRLLCGFSYPTSGTIELFGKIKEKELVEERERIGCIIENPGLIPNMSAIENLEYHRILRGIPDEDCTLELLETVGLPDTKKKTKDFSLGMKQRLGIAIALLGNPELLILDEPINGLDPVGVVEIRELIKRLCKERHITILISSHNLPELYQTATDYIILHQGEVKQILTLEELEDKCRHHLKISCDNTQKLLLILEQQLKTDNFIVMPDQTVKLYDYVNEKEKVAKAIFDNDMYPLNFSLEGDTLENYFISVVGRNEE